MLDADMDCAVVAAEAARSRGRILGLAACSSSAQTASRWRKRRNFACQPESTDSSVAADKDIGALPGDWGRGRRAGCVATGSQRWHRATIVVAQRLAVQISIRMPPTVCPAAVEDHSVYCPSLAGAAPVVVVVRGDEVKWMMSLSISREFCSDHSTVILIIDFQQAAVYNEFNYKLTVDNQL